MDKRPLEPFFIVRKKGEAMKAVVVEQIGSFSIREIEIPKVSPEEVLVRVQVTGLCRTDLKIVRVGHRDLVLPRVPGEEVVGVIEEVGAEVSRFRTRQRVYVYPGTSCGVCDACRRGAGNLCASMQIMGFHRDGGFAEYVSVPAENVLHIDSRIPDEIVSIMDPLGNATHTALSFPLIGEDVLVTGAGGPIGCMAIAISRFVGARNVVGSEVSPYRRELARKMGATLVIDPFTDDIQSAMKQVGMVAGFDIGLEVSGSPVAFDSMIKHMYNGGKISLLGILPDTTQIEWDKVIFKGLTLKGIYGREMYETWYKMEKMLLSGLDVSPVITHRFHYTEFQKAFEIMEEGNCGKIILDWE